MSKRIVTVLVAVAFGLGVGAGMVGLLWATGRISEPSRDTAEVAPTLSLNDPTPTPGALGMVGTEIAAINSKLDDLSTQMVDLASNATETNMGSPTVTSTPEEDAPVLGRALYRITEDESSAHFKIDEILAGVATTVTGTTRRVAGDIIIDFADPPASQLGTVAINVRTIRTDNEFRDQSIRGQILRSSEEAYEFVVFEPVELVSLASTPADVGDTVAFQIVGDLTVVGVRQRVTFDATVTIVSEDRIEGFASTQVLYEDFGLTINPPPAVGGIADEVILEIEFVALRVEE